MCYTVHEYMVLIKKTKPQGRPAGCTATTGLEAVYTEATIIIKLLKRWENGGTATR